MAGKSKVSIFKTITDKSSTQVQMERRSTPFLTRVPQQNVREGEFPGQKIKNIRADTEVEANTGSLSTDSGVTITSQLTANDAFVINPFFQLSIFVDTNNNTDYLWPNGASIVGTGLANLQLGFVQDINTATAGLNTNEARFYGIITNRDVSAHTYYLHVRWLYEIIE